MTQKTSSESDGVYAEDSNLSDQAGANRNILGLPVSIVVSVGSVRMTIDELLSLNADSVLPLNASIDDPVELLIGEKLIARGALVETDAAPGLGVRILSVLNSGERAP